MGMVYLSYTINKAIMWALGILFKYVIYIVLAIISVNYLVKGYLADKGRKRKFVWGIIFGALFISYAGCDYLGNKSMQKDHMGKYYLTQYPGCDSTCYIELHADMTYSVMKKEKEIETGDWHHEAAADYFITYLNGEKDQLGGNEYDYYYFEPKYPR